MVYVVYANELKRERAALASLQPLEDAVDIELEKQSGVIVQKRSNSSRMRLDELPIEARRSPPPPSRRWVGDVASLTLSAAARRSVE